MSGQQGQQPQAQNLVNPYTSKSTLYKVPEQQYYVSGTSAQQTLSNRIAQLRSDINAMDLKTAQDRINAHEARKYLDQLINNYTIQWNYATELGKIIDEDTKLGTLKTALQEKVKQLQDEIVYSAHEEYESIQVSLYKRKAQKLQEQERLVKEMNKQYRIVNGVYASGLFPVGIYEQAQQQQPQRGQQPNQQGQQQ